VKEFAVDKTLNAGTTPPKITKPGWNKKRSFVVFVVLPIIFIVLIPLGGLLYLCGRLSLHAGLVMCMLYPATGIFIIFCFVTGIARLTRGWRGDMKILFITQVGLPILFVILSFIGSPILIKSRLWPDATPFTYGFRDRIKSKADIPAIRAWLRTLAKSDYYEAINRLPPSQWPESLRAIKPGVVMLEADDNGNPRVRIIWGGGFFHWGVTIGLEDMKIPPSKLDEHYETWLLVEPGVYVFDLG
jgi:hypothetical protein